MHISKIFYFVLILYLILGKVTKFLVEKLSTSEVISLKPDRRVENTPPPSVFRVKQHENRWSYKEVDSGDHKLQSESLTLRQCDAFTDDVPSFGLFIEHLEIFLVTISDSGISIVFYTLRLIARITSSVQASFIL